jgi:hypothetical protein
LTAAEALAEPGGICVSRAVRDQVRDRLDFAFEEMGNQQVKNIARPVRVHRVGDRAAPFEQGVRTIYSRKERQAATGPPGVSPQPSPQEPGLKTRWRAD